MSLSRPTASKFARKLCLAAGLATILLCLMAASALAATPAPPPPEAKVEPPKLPPPNVNSELAVCAGQAFSQPFEALHDDGYYTLVEGSEFDESAEGWQLTGGAQIVADGPVGSSGHSLDLPAGAEAISPSVCVTLQYPTARVWVRNVVGGGGLAVSLAYAGTKTEEQPQNVGQVHGQGNDWTLATPFNLQPQIAGPLEAVRHVRIHFTATGQGNDYRIFGLYVDPRMQ